MGLPGPPALSPEWAAPFSELPPRAKHHGFERHPEKNKREKDTAPVLAWLVFWGRRSACVRRGCLWGPEKSVEAYQFFHSDKSVVFNIKYKGMALNA